jgi:hypothetical protein
MDKFQQNITSKLQFAENPRKISASQREQLSFHLQKYGDLGGVIYCKNNKAYVGGNQPLNYFRWS